ncbi:MAG: Calx-beta domain-containing protein [Verrucomicrobiaceae bacterium]
MKTLRLSLAVLLLLSAFLFLLPTPTTREEASKASLPPQSARDFITAWQDPSSPQSDLLQAAGKHRESFTRLMIEAPDVALIKALSSAEHHALPPELKPFFAQPFTSPGSIDQLWAVTELPDGSRRCTSENTVTFGTETLTAHTPDLTLLPVLNNVPLSGIRLGNHAVISPSTDSGEIATYQSSAPGEKTTPTLAGSDGGDHASAPTDATPYQEDQIDVLFIRVDFSDFPGAPVSKAALETTLATVDGHLANYSYNQAGITYTVSDSVYRMPSTGASYAVNKANDDIQTHARALASADFTLSNYDVIAVFFPDIGDVPGSQITYGGLASIGGENHWINGTNSVGIILHEFGHNYGLYHANYHHPEMELSGTYQDANSLEYGDIFDEMGSGNSPEAHFSHLAKNYMQWMPDSKVAEATGDATYTIYRFDDPNALSNPLLAVKVPMSDDVNYWIGYRQLYTSSTYNLETAAYVVGENLASNRETSLIDMTPESEASETADRRDAGLPVGGTFYEPTSGVRFNALERGGSDPNQWIKVQVLFDPRISIASTALSIDEQCGTATVTVQRQFSDSGAVTVNYATANGTALAGTDYYPASGTLTWADGDLSDKTITIPIRPDIISEGSETLTLALSGIIGGKLDPDASLATISILDAGQRIEEFAPGFFNTTVEAIVPLADGKVIIGGNIGGAIGNVAPLFHIARLLPDGSVDTTFLTGTGFNAPVETIVAQPDGKLLVGGDFTSYNGTSCNRLTRLLPDGNIDASFATAIGNGANDTVRSFAIEDSGNILVGGDFTSFDGSPDLGLTRLLASGSRNSASPITLPFDTGFGTEIYAILPEPSGKIVVAGSFYVGWTGSGFRAGLARLNSNGSRDTTFDPDAGAHASGNNSSLRRVYDLTSAPGGKYLIAGSFTAYDENAVAHLARINNDGTFDSSFTPPAFDDTARVILTQPSGLIVTAGGFTSPVNRLERLTPSGASDLGFNQGSGPSGTVYALANGSDGSLWAGGNFFNYNGSSSRPVVKIAGGVSPYDLWAQSQFTSTQIAAGQAATDQDPDADGLVNLVEMALSTNPNLANSEPAFQVKGSGITLQQDNSQQYLQISLDRTALPKGAWFAAQFSSNLSTWSPASPTPGTSATYEIISDSVTNFTVRDNTPTTGATPRFARILVINPQ